jgi:hypothetical protein
MMSCRAESEVVSLDARNKGCQEEGETAKTYIGERSPGDLCRKDSFLVVPCRQLGPDAVEDALALLLALSAREALEWIELDEHPPPARSGELVVLILAEGT